MEEQNQNESNLEPTEVQIDTETSEVPADPRIVDGLPLQNVVESIIFASTEPLPMDRLLECIQKDYVQASLVRQVIDEINKHYQANNLPLRIIKIAGGYQYATHPQYDKWVSRLFKSKAEKKLSQSSLEVLAIVAYRQPISRAEIERIRGVNADWTLRSLMEKNLITVVGREDAPGKPLLFGTTKPFLEHFGLDAINELPKLKEIEDIIKEDKEFAETLEFDFADKKAAEAAAKTADETAKNEGLSQEFAEIDTMLKENNFNPEDHLK
ncbi:SMC-Scp complex subunit ScpB [bacterium]|nr:SMC-Scp complex subunit ScpB [bacterium]NUN44361.1 SMC-Scp complex subunit ScpB [bacterium]